MRVGFIGLGTMGRPMAEHVLAAGHELVVNDARREAGDPLVKAGARWTDSPAETAKGAEIVLTSLPGPKEVEAVVLGENGVFAGAARGTIYADLSTSSVSLIRRIHALGRDKGIEVLDTPVSGGPHGAQNGTLAIMVGGEEGVYERARPVLAAMGDKLGYIGASGAGAVAKLVHNFVAAASFQALAEGMTLGVKAGVDPEKLLKAVQDGAFGQGYFLRHRMPNVVLADDYDNPAFMLQLMRKDVGLATELAREHNVPMAMGALAEQELITAVARGWGRKDSSAVFLLQEERAGVKVRASSAKVGAAR